VFSSPHNFAVLETKAHLGPNLGLGNMSHISIVKSILCHENYYYHELGGYSLVAQIVVNYKKKFIDVFVGFPRNLNDLRVLHKFTFYKKS